MAKSKTIYSLKGIFTNFLEDTEKKYFMIPVYQRGYKWSSSGSNSQVELLMKDLHSAFENNRPKYYLQFLTLKMNGDVLEVIDGQQRLTTLTILFCVLNHLETNAIEDNFVLGKLNFQVRENFIKKYIYEHIEHILTSNNWEEFVETNEEHNNQDVYFIYNATLAINKYINTNISPNKLKKFYDYLCDNVSLIVNPLESDVNSEKIFINVNKGVKLLDEDLVKGLLITKIPLDNQSQNIRMTENEVNEIRTNIGRQWDEMSRWASRADINSFFKIANSNLEWLILLAFPIEKTNNPNPIFTYLDNLHRQEGALATEIFDKIRKTMFTLNDWYCEPELCNLLGYTLHANKTKGLESTWNELCQIRTKGELLTELKKKTAALLPLNENNELRHLNYVDDKPYLFNLFLFLDVAKFLPIDKRKVIKYDFDKISSQDWSIEHIFPQDIEEFKTLKSLKGADLALVKELLPQKFNDVIIEDVEKKKEILKLFIKIQKEKIECTIEENEREHLNYLLEKCAGDLHRIGNLALLERGMNSGLSNHFFDAKRKIIARKVSKGEFVPFHTYDVFSKLVIESDTGLHSWSKTDIAKHETYINNQIKGIVNYLNSNDSIL